MKLLALDLATTVGWAFFLNGEADIQYGVIRTDKPILAHGEYPWCYLYASDALAYQVEKLVSTMHPDTVVIEETNLGKSRYAQKALEFIHNSVLRHVKNYGVHVSYVSSSEWRRALNLQLTREDKRANGKLSRAKRRAKDMNTKLDKKSLGIRGRVNKKHLSIRFVNATYNLNLKMKDDDIADAICLGVGFLRGATVCNGE